MCVFVIGCLEHLRRFLVAEDSSGCERLWGVSGLDKALRHFGFDAVYKQAPADRAAWRYRLLQSLELHHSIAHRRSRIENDVSKVAQLLAVCPLACAGVAVDLTDN